MIKRTWVLVLLCLLPLIDLMLSFSPSAQATLDGFVEVGQFIPSIQLDIKYYTEDNFIGEPIDGYTAGICLLTREATSALLQVQTDLLSQGYSLQIYDGYRPQRAVDHFVRWAADLSDTRMQDRFYPHVAKQDLFTQGYIARRSSHSRGSTVDLTLVQIDPQTDPPKITPIDMGSEFDFFNPISHTFNDQITEAQRTNRMRLKQAMERHGFRNYPQEWWHYTLIDEPYPHTYFDFPVESIKIQPNSPSGSVDAGSEVLAGAAVDPSVSVGDPTDRGGRPT